jgi:hypothetical protein
MTGVGATTGLQVGSCQAMRQLMHLHCLSHRAIRVILDQTHAEHSFSSSSTSESVAERGFETP